MRVLVVDDEPNIRRTLRGVGNAGPHRGRSGIGGRKLRRGEVSPIDVALVNMRLGSDSGLDLIEALRAATRLGGGRDHGLRFV